MPQPDFTQTRQQVDRARRDLDANQQKLLLAGENRKRSLQATNMDHVLISKTRFLCP